MTDSLCKDGQRAVIGKVYWNECGACKALELQWEKLQTELKPFVEKQQVIFWDIEVKDPQKKEKVQQLEDECGIELDTGGSVPKIYCVCKKKLHFYDGERTAEAIKEWFLKCAGLDANTDTDATQRGGRRHRTRRRRFMRRVASKFHSRKHFSRAHPSHTESDRCPCRRRNSGASQSLRVFGVKIW